MRACVRVSHLRETSTTSRSVAFASLLVALLAAPRLVDSLVAIDPAAGFSLLGLASAEAILCVVVVAILVVEWRERERESACLLLIQRSQCLRASR